MLPPVALCAGDVARLISLVAGTQKNDDGVSLSPEIDSVPRAVVNAKLQQALAHRLAVAEVPVAKAGNPGIDFVDCAGVPQGTQPLVERAAAVACGVDLNFDLWIVH